MKKYIILLFIVFLQGETFTQSSGGQCVAYARQETGNSYTTSPGLCSFDNSCGAYLIYDHWDYGYGRGNIPHNNSLIVLAASGSLSVGHVGIVRSASQDLADSNIYNLSVDESNWYLDEYITTSVWYQYNLSNNTVRRQYTALSNRVATVNSNLGNTNYHVRGFVYTQPNNIQLIEPQEGDRENSSSVNFSWVNNSNYPSHRIVISTEESYVDSLGSSGDWCLGKSSSTCYTTTVSSSSTTVQKTINNSTLLTNGRKYYWKVRSALADQPTLVSDTSMFYRPIEISLNSPTNGSTIPEGSATLSWDSEGATNHRYILSTDSSYINNLQVSGSWDCNGQSSSSCYTGISTGQSATINNSTLLSSGKTFYLRMRASEPEPEIPDEITSVRNFSIQTVNNDPDLIVQTAAVSTDTLTTGEVFTAYGTVKNQGSGSASSTTLRYYRSTNSNITSSDTQLGTDGVSALSAGATSSENASFSISTAGTYWIGSCVDSVAGESSTTNNCSAGVQVTVSAPALDDTYEENDVQEDAFALTKSRWLSSINGAGIKLDDDWYKITVPPGSEHIQIDLQFTHSEGDIDIEFTDAAGTQLAYSNGVSNSEFIDTIVPSSGIYFILVNYENEGNDYDLQWKTINSSGGNNNFQPAVIMYLLN